MVGEDSRKRLYMMDEAGSLYYDSGNAEVGFFQVRRTGPLGRCAQDAGGAGEHAPASAPRHPTCSYTAKSAHHVISKRLWAGLCLPSRRGSHAAAVDVLQRMQVTPDEDVYNIYQDASERMQSKLLGKLSDLETVPVESVAGIPFKYAPSFRLLGLMCSIQGLEASKPCPALSGCRLSCRAQQS